MLSLNVTTLAHSGRTDSNGGHKDNKNASGLGSYHYHCGGHPAHLHDGGVCPYKTQTPSTTYTPPETTTSPETTPPETNIPPETTAPPETTTPPKTNIPPVTTASPTLTAMPTSSSVYVNGKQVSFDAYCINNSNYFKLRDLAFALNGTEKQFEVTWNSEGNAIEISCGIPYTAVGGELQGGGNGSKSPILTTSQLYVDRKEISLTVYSIEGYNYFRLRDIGDVCSFNVTWENNSIKINT
jgi:hypothetical protein